MTRTNWINFSIDMSDMYHHVSGEINYFFLVQTRVVRNQNDQNCLSWATEKFSHHKNWHKKRILDHTIRESDIPWFDHLLETMVKKVAYWKVKEKLESPGRGCLQSITSFSGNKLALKMVTVSRKFFFWASSLDSASVFLSQGRLSPNLTWSEHTYLRT